MKYSRKFAGSLAQNPWALAAILACAAIIAVFASLAYRPSEVFSGISCRKVSENERYCSFSCALSPKSPGQTGRFIVMHSIWSAIYVNETALPETLEIDLPKRGYDYIAFLSIYDSEGKVGYGKPIPVLKC